ncbi:helix-turn-helix domain-containing protein [Hydrogenimonas sp.]
MQDNIVKRTCKELGITQKELAERLGVPQSTVSRWSSDEEVPRMAQKYLDLLLEYEALFEKYETIKKACKILYTDITRE